VISGHGFPVEHVAIVVGRRGSTPTVVSNRSEAGPFYLRYDYRGDVLLIPRYI
jgi:hypothetical protein